MKNLIRLVCESQLYRAQMQANIILNKASSPKDLAFKEEMLQLLNGRTAGLPEVPEKLKDVLVFDDMTAFPLDRFFLRDEEAKMVDKLLTTYAVADRMADLGVSYLPSVILHGASGTGKTMLAKYIACKAGLPFLYVRFSALISSYMGETSGRLSAIFSYIKSVPCVLCIDEIDAIGMQRTGGNGNTGGEMGRVVIGLMQELDRCPNTVLLIGTTNRFNRLDPALVNRFSAVHEVYPLAMEDICHVVERFFASTGISLPKTVSQWCEEEFTVGVSTRVIIRRCTEHLAVHLATQV